MPPKRKHQQDNEAEETIPPEPETTIEEKQAPEPVNRAILKKVGLIKVKANRALGEFDEAGNMRRYVAGDVFTIDAARAKSLGNQVTITEG